MTHNASPEPRPVASIAGTHGPVSGSAPWWNPQRGSAMPAHRYRPVHERVSIPTVDRTWPDKRVTAAPLWVPVDLRDGNQALLEPMDSERKLRAFQLFVAMGFKEMEVGYPSASSLDFDFVRLLATKGLVPDDVSVVVFTPARTDLIARTFESIEGLPRAVVHMYTATAPTWRNVVLGHDRDALLQLILRGAADVLSCADALPGTFTRFQFSPEVFNLTEPDYALEVCNAVTELWDASPDRPVIHNLPTTVEASTPNIYADQIEWMDRNLARRESVILSIHPHNDRGTGVASAELALMAGAQRVEGCLFGNGERTGNVDLVTLALNLLTQGVDPMLDLSNIDEVRRTVEHYNGLPVAERHPYAGDLVYTAFSGTHQDAIRKGFAHHERQAAELGVTPAEAPWDIPYLPIDPADVGRSYEAVIRINSQSGKGGVAYLLQSEMGLELPRPLQIEFSRVVQKASETAAAGGEVTGERLCALFTAEYLDRTEPVALRDWSIDDRPGGPHGVTATLRVNGVDHDVVGTGNGPLDAFTDALAQAGLDFDIVGYSEHAVRSGRDSAAAAYVECRVQDKPVWGVGVDTSVVAASLKAVVSALNRAM